MADYITSMEQDILVFDREIEKRNGRLREMMQKTEYAEKIFKTSREQRVGHHLKLRAKHDEYMEAALSEFSRETMRAAKKFFEDNEKVSAIFMSRYMAYNSKTDLLDRLKLLYPMYVDALTFINNRTTSDDDKKKLRVHNDHIKPKFTDIMVIVNSFADNGDVFQRSPTPHDRMLIAEKFGDIDNHIYNVVNAFVHDSSPS